MNNLERAKAMLKDGGYTCVLCSDNETKTSTERGVKPLLEFVDSGEDFGGFSAADKVIGKAAAFLYAVLGIKTVYADVISRPALSVFHNYGIGSEYGEAVDSIINRSGTGICPMEQATAVTDDRNEALSIIKNKLKELNS